jgi:hypothetical protein
MWNYSSFCQEIDSVYNSSRLPKKKVVRKDIDISSFAPSSTTEIKCQVVNTNFTIPLVRFNTVKSSGVDNNQKGNVSLFNSIGAGISYNWGRMLVTTNDNGEVINTEMQNTLGIQLGVLFAVNSSTGNNANIFAPTISFSVLNFQIGCGYELGSLPEKENRFFYTLAYGIPLSKLIRGGFYVVRKFEVTDNKNGFMY